MTVLDDAVDPARQPESGSARLLLMAIALLAASLGGAALASVAGAATGDPTVIMAE